MLTFADDLVLLAPSPEEIQRLMDTCVEFCTENGLKINIKKTKAMYVNSHDILNVGEKQVETVTDFKYLGLRMSKNSRKPECLL